MHTWDIRRLEYILHLMSSIVEHSKQGLWLMDILPRNQPKQFTQELCHCTEMCQGKGYRQVAPINKITLMLLLCNSDH